jgi:hypothetical protein
MTVRELIEKLKAMPQDATVRIGYDGNYVSVEPNGRVYVVQEGKEGLYDKPGQVFIEGEGW